MTKKPSIVLDAKQVILTYNGRGDFYKYLASHGITIKEINQRSCQKYANGQIIELSPVENGNSFDGADKLYKLCSRKNSKTKVIYDDFSIVKASVIYGKIIELETNIRKQSAEVMIKNGHSVGRNYRKGRNTISIRLKRKLPDYEVSQTTIDALINHVLAIGIPKIIDTLRLRTAKKELAILHEARNKVMHANVITDSQFGEYERAIKDIDATIRNSLKLDMFEAFANYAKTL